MLLSINTKIKNKPSKPGGSAYSTGWEPRDLSINELEYSIKEGNAFSAQYVGGNRGKDNFIVSGFIAIDIDDGLKLDEALTHPYVKQHAALVYTTPSHSESNNRFRIVFELEQPISDGESYRNAVSSMIRKFNSDDSCKDIARLFYGSSNGLTKCFGHKLSTAEVDMLIETEKHRVAEVENAYDAQQEGSPIGGRGGARRLSNYFDTTLIVKTSYGAFMSVDEAAKNHLSIHCPFHNDQRPSAKIIRSTQNTLGIYCHACSTTFWSRGQLWEPNFNLHARYVVAAETDYEISHSGDESFDSKNPPVYVANDGSHIQLYDHEYLPSIELKSRRPPAFSSKAV